MDLRFRTATPDDLERLLAIHAVAYPDERTAAERRRNFTANPFGELSDLVVAERDGSIVAHAFLFGLEAWFGGRAVRVGAVASVAVAPEARSQGVATALLAHLHDLSDARGDALTMLYAFRQRFYARLGYGASMSRRRLVVDPASIPRAWCALARAHVRAAGAGAGGADVEGMRAAYDRDARRRTGWLVRSDAMWERRLARERRQFLVAGPPSGARASGEPTVRGYVAFEVVQEEAHAETTLVVDELVADDFAIRHALLGALGAMRGQVHAVELELEASDPLEIALVDPDGRRAGNDVVEHELGAVVGGPMVRIEDVTRALEARGYAADGAFDVVVHGGGGEGANGAADEIAVSVEVAGGRASVAPPRAAAGALRTTRAGLASILYGGVRVSDAIRLGLVDAEARTATRADAVLALPPPLPLDPF